MDRVMEPEVMDGEAQAEAYARADFAEVNQAFVDRFLSTFPALRRGEVADLGCGPADIPIRLCRSLPGVKVCAVDASASMMALARQAVGEAGLASRIELVLGYCPIDFEPPRRFDAVISNSLLHHLPDPKVLWQQIKAIGGPGTAVLVVDLMRPGSTEEARAVIDTYAVDEPEVLRHDFYHSLLAAFTPDEVRAQIQRAGLHGLQLHNISDRHFAVWGHM